ncbi:UNVERIFIED_CONTAM: hypothetical protein Sindi_2501300 [Sesamum indicum]
MSNACLQVDSYIHAITGVFNHSALGLFSRTVNTFVPQRCPIYSDSMIRTPLQIDEATFNQFKLSKARDSECYSKGNAPKPPPRMPSKPIVADVKKRKGKQVVEAMERDKAPICEIGECPKTMDQTEPSQITKDDRYHIEYTIDYVTSVDSTFIFANEASKLKDHVVVHENIVSVDVADNTCVNDRTGDGSLVYKVDDGN